MIRYQVLRVNRVWIVTDNQTKDTVGEPWRTELEAVDTAARLNRRVWLESRPDAAMGWGDDYDRRLQEILDRVSRLGMAS